MRWWYGWCLGGGGGGGAYLSPATFIKIPVALGTSEYTEYPGVMRNSHVPELRFVTFSIPAPKLQWYDRQFEVPDFLQ
jgi:hypothetical protein